MVYRLLQDWKGKMEGSCISEEKYMSVFYRDKYLYEPIIDKNGLIEYRDENYCSINGIECMLFYSNLEYIQFLNKVQNVAVLN